jgi:HEAT repeat protein
VQLCDDKDGEVRAAAAEALGNRNPSYEGIAAVRRGLADSAALVRLHSAKALWRLTAESEPVLPVLIAILPLPESWQAAYALADLGELAEPAVPSLTQALRRERVPRPFRTPPSCAFALGKIGPAAIPALQELLVAEEARVRLNAVLAIGFMAQRGRAAVPDLLPLLDDKDAEVRHATALTLAAIGADSNQVIAGLSACLSAEDIYMRSAAAHVLREIAPHQNWVVDPE